MNKQQITKQAIALLLAVLCGACAGMLIPCQNCVEQTSVAAFSDAGDVAAGAFVAGAEKPSGIVQADGAQVETAPSNAEPVEINLFAIDPVESDAPEGSGMPTLTAEQPSAPELEQTPAPSEAQAPAFSIEVLGTGKAAPAKRVLIYHTHTYEAYEQIPDDPYQETEQWRTADDSHNMVRVGAELAGLLRGLGLEVVHDTTAFEPPNLSTSYARSLDMLKARRDAGEHFDLYIDVHRDAYVGERTGANTVSAGSVQAAKLMMLIGKGEGQTEEGFDEKPDWQNNLLIAQRMTDSLNAQVSGLCKDVRIKSGRFNQHIAVGCLLVEVGNNRNTLAEALAAMPYLADAIDEVLGAGDAEP